MKGSFIPSLIVLVFTAASPSFAAEPRAEPPQSAYSVRWENDTFGGTDANYTNGTSLAVTRAGKGLFGGVWDFAGVAGGENVTIYELTQLQFTPSELKLSSPDLNDRPYAGLTYLGCTTHLLREESLHSLKVLAGVVGQASGAEEIQRSIHRVFAYAYPRGWSHQLENEPVVNLLYEYRHKVSLTPPGAAVGVELLPMGGAYLGNYLIQAQSELQFRIGYHLPPDFGGTSLRGIGYLPSPQLKKTDHSWGIEAYCRVGAQLVAWNLTLDGNTFDESPHVEKRRIVLAGEVGLGLWTRQFLTTVSFQKWGREFSGQPEREGYGSILISLFF